MMNRFIAHNMPKIELHCHLDGSVSLPLIQKLMQQEKKEPLGLEELREKLVAPMDCSSLAEYLEKFELPLGCRRRGFRQQHRIWHFLLQKNRSNIWKCVLHLHFPWNRGFRSGKS